MNRPATFKQADLTRALRALKAEGVKFGEVSIEVTGCITIRAAGHSPASEYDNWQAKKGQS
ncbi:hypothetical protein [Sandarakinorhabdus sp.]|uniref:hypothetical protein n=1 Tax=Sandarakinorhabdus sp. TaxID=1916663 RepID=UPI00286DEAE4|nr:hypothetical protein [Sandarakinorhabdus sp.]